MSENQLKPFPTTPPAGINRHPPPPEEPRTASLSPLKPFRILTSAEFRVLLKAMRRKKGVSQEHLAKLAGVNVTGICFVETDRRNVGMDYGEKLWSALCAYKPPRKQGKRRGK